MRKVEVQAPDIINTQGLKLIEENVLPKLRHLKTVCHSGDLG